MEDADTLLKLLTTSKAPNVLNMKNGNFTNSLTGEIKLADNATEDYDYDYNESLRNFNWKELTPPLIAYTFIFILGVTGNVLIIYTIARFRRLKSTTNVFLSSLASADLLVITICVPVKVIF